MAANYELISLLEQFWRCQQQKGFVRITTKKGVIIGLIAELLPVTNDRYDRIVKLEKTDGQEVTFKLSDLVSVEETLLLNVQAK